MRVTPTSSVYQTPFRAGISNNVSQKFNKKEFLEGAKVVAVASLPAILLTAIMDLAKKVWGLFKQSDVHEFY